MTVRGGNLLVRNRQILILVCREGRTLQEVHRLALVGIELVDDTGGITPAHEVEETLTLHGQLQATLHLHNLHGLILVISTSIFTYCIAYTILIGVARNDAVRHHTGSTLANLIDKCDGLRGIVQLSLCLSTHQQHIGIAQHYAIHRRSPLVIAVEEVDVRKIGVYILFQRNEVSIVTTRAAPCVTFAHHVCGIEHIRSTGHSYCHEEAGINGLVRANLVVD